MLVSVLASTFLVLQGRVACHFLNIQIVNYSEFAGYTNLVATTQFGHCRKAAINHTSANGHDRTPMKPHLQKQPESQIWTVVCQQ